jgi:transcriptional antiterminator
MWEIAEYLKDYHTEEKNAINCRELAQLYNVTSKQIRNIVSALRQDGAPICSSSAGYWYSEDKGDLLRTLNKIRSQIHNMECTATGLEKTLLKLGADM